MPESSSYLSFQKWVALLFFFGTISTTIADARDLDNCRTTLSGAFKKVLVAAEKVHRAVPHFYWTPYPRLQKKLNLSALQDPAGIRDDRISIDQHSTPEEKINFLNQILRSAPPLESYPSLPVASLTENLASEKILLKALRRWKSAIIDEETLFEIIRIQRDAEIESLVSIKNWPLLSSNTQSHYHLFALTHLRYAYAYMILRTALLQKNLLRPSELGEKLFSKIKSGSELGFNLFINYQFLLFLKFPIVIPKGEIMSGALLRKASLTFLAKNTSTTLQMFANRFRTPLYFDYAKLWTRKIFPWIASATIATLLYGDIQSLSSGITNNGLPTIEIVETRDQVEAQVIDLLIHKRNETPDSARNKIKKLKLQELLDFRKRLTNTIDQE